MNFIGFLKREFNIKNEVIAITDHLAVEVRGSEKAKLVFKPLINAEQHKNLSKVLDVKIDEQPENEVVDIEDEQVGKWQNHVYSHKTELFDAKKETQRQETGIVAWLDKEIKIPTLSFKMLHHVVATAVLLLFAISALMAIPTVVQKRALAKNEQLGL